MSQIDVEACRLVERAGMRIARLDRAMDEAPDILARVDVRTCDFIERCPVDAG
jgi:hypothetical protein